MIEPPPRARMSSATACAAKNWCLKLTATSRSESCPRRGDRGMQRGHIRHVAFEEERLVVGTQLTGQRAAGFRVEVAEGDARALRVEGAHQCFADAGCAAGDEDGAADQRWIAC